MSEEIRQPKIHTRKVPYTEKNFQTRIARDKDGSMNDQGFNGVHGTIHHNGKHVGNFILKDDGESDAIFQTQHKKQVAKVKGAGKAEQGSHGYVQQHHPHSAQEWGSHCKHHQHDDHQAIFHFLSDKDKHSLHLRNKAIQLRDKKKHQFVDKPADGPMHDDDLDAIDWTGKGHTKTKLVQRLIQIASNR